MMEEPNLKKLFPLNLKGLITAGNVPAALALLNLGNFNRLRLFFTGFGVDLQPGAAWLCVDFEPLRPQAH
jgi:hypothetical protein